MAVGVKRILPANRVKLTVLLDDYEIAGLKKAPLDVRIADMTGEVIDETTASLSFDKDFLTVLNYDPTARPPKVVLGVQGYSALREVGNVVNVILGSNLSVEVTRDY
ncbi:MAG: hypothetical protein Q8L27_04560 [archaeon]|nr:hypothetical protein [archaeon]